MYADCTCQLCDTCDRHLHLLACSHDKVAELVDDNHDVRHELVSVFRIESAVQELVVIFLYITRTGELQQVVAVVHECTQTLQCAYHLRNVGDDRFVVVVNLRHEVVGDRRVDAELHLLRVDEHQLQFVRMLLVEQRSDDDVQTD